MLHLLKLCGRSFICFSLCVKRISWSLRFDAQLLGRQEMEIMCKHHAIDSIPDATTQAATLRLMPRSRWRFLAFSIQEGGT